MKTCGRCKQTLPFESFNFRNKARGTYQGYCKDCNKDYNKQHYIDNAQDYYAKSRALKAANKENSIQELFKYLSAHPCVDCGEADPVVLEFDHREQSHKRFPISDRLNDGYSWAYVLREIEKCDVRCANCHRRRTARQLGWRKAEWLTSGALE